MNYRFAFFLPLAAALSFSTCKQNEDPQPSKTSVQQLLSELVSPPEKFIIYNAAISKSFYTSNGIRFVIQGGCLVNEVGKTPTSPIEILVTPMLTPGDMIRNNCPTMGPDGLFISGGQFYISATANGQTLHIDSAKGFIQVFMPPIWRLDNPTRPFPIWSGTRNALIAGENIPAVSWTPVLSSLPDSTPGDTSLYLWNQSIQFFALLKLGYINLDIYYPVTSPKTDINIKVPAGINFDNSVCFLSFPSINSIGPVPIFTPANFAFSVGPNRQIPIGLNAKAVVISKVSGQYKYGVTAFSVTQDAEVFVVPENVTLDQILAKLEEL